MVMVWVVCWIYVMSSIWVGCGLVWRCVCVCWVWCVILVGGGVVECLYVVGRGGVEVVGGYVVDDVCVCARGVGCVR